MLCVFTHRRGRRLGDRGYNSGFGPRLQHLNRAAPLMVKGLHYASQTSASLG
jgi:hypothetical protein